MNINDLIGGNPDLLEDLLGLGLSERQVDDLGLQVSAQLRRTQLSAQSPTGLRDLLVQMNAEAFLDRLDVDTLANTLACDPLTVQSALIRIASTVTLFDQQ